MNIFSSVLYMVIMLVAVPSHYILIEELFKKSQF